LGEPQKVVGFFIKWYERKHFFCRQHEKEEIHLISSSDIKSGKTSSERRELISCHQEDAER
jgi:hypothetical protein